MIYLEVQFAGEGPRRVSLPEFLAANESVPALCAQVSSLLPGQSITYGQLTVTHVVATPRTSQRVARFKVDFGHRRYKAEGATVTVNRDTGMVTVRLLRRRAEHFMALADVAAIVYERSIKAEAVRKRKEKKAARKARSK